jgi:multisubunit Na+/H+ antiporter MnhC subunit
MINIINIAIIILILAGIFLLLKYKKLETLAVLAALKAEGITMITGSKKLEYAVDWLYSQKLFKDSFLSLIPKNFTKWVVNFVFNQKKLLIEMESRKKKI